MEKAEDNFDPKSYVMIRTRGDMGITMVTRLHPGPVKSCVGKLWRWGKIDEPLSFARAGAPSFLIPWEVHGEVVVTVMLRENRMETMTSPGFEAQ